MTGEEEARQQGAAAFVLATMLLRELAPDRATALRIIGLSLDELAAQPRPMGLAVDLLRQLRLHWTDASHRGGTAD